MKFLANPILFVLLACFASSAQASPQPVSSVHWVGSWAAAQQIPEPENSLLAGDFRDATLRQIVHLSIGGSRVRVHLSNAFGTAPLRFTSVHIARPVSPSTSRIDVATDKALTFAGSAEVIVPAGAEYISDPIDYNVPALSNLAITFHLDASPAPQTGHPGSRATSYIVPGDFVSAAELTGAHEIDHWYQIAAVDVAEPATAASIVVLGDSITDGHGSAINGNGRWTDTLAQRLHVSPSAGTLGVLNLGIGGNHLLVDGLGPNALARFDRDVLAQTGVRYLIVLEGVNDLGGLTRRSEVPAAEHGVMVHRILSAYQQIVLRAHLHGIRVIGATILPYAGSDYYHPTLADELDRQAVNRWIRVPGNFDAVIDFDKRMRDPSHSDRLLPAYDSGDHLHPSAAGYQAMGKAVSPTLFVQ